MSENFEAVFARLRGIMLANMGDQLVSEDEPGSLIVNAGECDDHGKHAFFGSVAIKKSYVAYHLMPLYCDPALGADLSVRLAKRKQGKSCFNFKAIDDDVFDELAALTARCAGK